MNTVLDSARNLYASLLARALPTYERGLLQLLLISRSKMRGVYGARGVGKTTLMLQWLKQQPFKPSETLYFSCDHPIFKGVELFELVDAFVRQGGRLVVIDEIHEMPGFEQALKSVYDFLDVQVVFSGSSAIALTHPDLSRRYAMFHLPPLSLREYIGLETGITLPSLSLPSLLDDAFNSSLAITQALGQHKILPVFNAYLQHGGYPFYFEDPASFAQKLGDTLNLVIQLELGRLFSIQPDKIDLLKKLLVVVSRSKPLELSIEKLTTNIELSKPTLYKYLDYLQRGELLRLVPHELKKLKTVRKPDKLYLHHPNLLQALCIQADVGILRETFFAAQLAGAGHILEFAQRGDFVVDESLVFEIGGRNKDFSQLKDEKRPAYLALDDIETAGERKIPLWLFGFLY